MVFRGERFLGAIPSSESDRCPSFDRHRCFSAHESTEGRISNIVRFMADRLRTLYVLLDMDGSYGFHGYTAGSPLGLSLLWGWILIGMLGIASIGAAIYSEWNYDPCPLA